MVAFSGGFGFIENAEKPKNTIKDYQCDQCEYKSKRKADLKKHRDNVHKEKPPKVTKCDQCDFVMAANMMKMEK